MKKHIRIIYLYLVAFLILSTVFVPFDKQIRNRENGDVLVSFIEYRSVFDETYIIDEKDFTTYKINFEYYKLNFLIITVIAICANLVIYLKSINITSIDDSKP